VRRDDHDATGLINLNVELGKEVFPAEDRNADVAEASLQLDFPPRYMGPERNWRPMMISETVPGIDRLRLALVEVDAKRLGIALRKD
jgi:hypothetical protein